MIKRPNVCIDDVSYCVSELAMALRSSLSVECLASSEKQTLSEIRLSDFRNQQTTTPWPNPQGQTTIERSASDCPRNFAVAFAPVISILIFNGPLIRCHLRYTDVRRHWRH